MQPRTRSWVPAAALAVAAIAAAAALYHAHLGPGRARQLLPPAIRGVLGDAPASLRVWSPAFPDGGPIPVRYAHRGCGGADESPPLRWSGVPAGAKSLLLVAYDPDAPRGPFIHWVAYNLPPSLQGLPASVPHEARVDGFSQAVNDYGFPGYGGPCPPLGRRHRYVFLVAALDTRLPLPPGLPAREVLGAARGHVLAYGYTYGVYPPPPRSLSR